MADTVNSQVIEDGPRNYVIRLTNISDGTGESDVVKVDVSGLTGPDVGVAPDRVAIKSIDYNVQGFDYVTLEFDATADDEIAVLGQGVGYLPFDPPVNNPKSSGYTGDVLLTTSGGASGSSYDITLHCIKKQ